MRLYEKEPARLFENAHLLGNGRLGATVYGGVPFEEILINEDTLWSGSESYRFNEEYYDKLMLVRQLTLEGKVREANDIVNDYMEGNWSESYLPLASAHITVGQGDDRRHMRFARIKEKPFSEIGGYSRTLELDTAVETIRYTCDDVRYQREYFVSHDRQLIYARLSAEGGPLCFSLCLTSVFKNSVTVSGGSVLLCGAAPDHVEHSRPVQPAFLYLNEESSNSLRFASCARIIDTDGTLSSDSARVYVNNASYAVIAIAAGTNYAGYMQPRDKDVNKVAARLEQQLSNAGCWSCALKEHLADYQALYNRFTLDLGDDITGELPTSQRLQMNATTVFDPSVSALAVQYTRYLLIASSRPGSQASNLQGIWNANPQPNWSSNYTTNINVEMNYWPAEQFNLSDCHEPMFDLVRECADSGKRTARDYYHLDGWVTHHNVDLWRMTFPACQDASWYFWPFGGVWMAQHLWTHYEYTKDEKFLREVAYPVLREAARFMLGWLCEDGDHLITAPSTSPENKHLIFGERTFRDVVTEVTAGNRFSPNAREVSALTKGSCADLAMIRELFGNVLSAMDILNEQGEMGSQLRSALERLEPFKIGALGTLQEWHEDYEDCTPGMGHVSHLYSVYPSCVINEQDYPAEFEAAYRSLQRRVVHNGMNHDWPGSWALCLGARFHDRTLCTGRLASVTQNWAANMLIKGYVQIDAVSGYAAGVGEMLLQSHNGYIELLPTPAFGWVNGSYTGMKARGGFECDLAWKNNAIVSGRILSPLGGECALKAKGLKGVSMADGSVKTPDADGIVRFTSDVGGEYTLIF